MSEPAIRVVRGDLTRRVCSIRLNAHVEQPDKRTFKRDAKAYVYARRASLIAAALIMAVFAYAGGTAGGKLAGKVKPQVLRRVIVVIGLIVSVIYIVK